MRKTIAACVVTALAVGGGSATAASLITSKDIKNGTISARDIKKGSITVNRLSIGSQALLRRAGTPGAPGVAGANGRNGATGATGAAGDDGGSVGAAGTSGQKGDKGDTGAKGDDGDNLSAGNWGIVNRNTIGSPDTELRSGPSTPPLGAGSLNMAVSGATGSSFLEKASFGNEVDFVGDPLSGIDAVGYRVFTTGENRAVNNRNLPNITFEVDPSGPSTTAPNFSSLVWLPPDVPANAWSPFVNANTADGEWYYTGAAGAGSGCTQSADPCSFAQTKAAFPNATVLSAAVVKGRDYSFQGAVDGLRIDGTTYDFEEDGVVETSTP